MTGANDGDGATPLPAPLGEPLPEPGLGDYLAVLSESRWLVLGALALALAAGEGWVLLATPLYVADATIQVEERRQTMKGLEELSSVFGERSEAETEMEILRSRSLLGSVVESLHLDVEARPRTFPVLGAAVARRRDPALGPASPILGLAGFAWGGEGIRVDRLEVPEALVDRRLDLVAGEAGRFELRDRGRLLARGEAGRLARGDSPAGPVEILVSELRARPGTRFAVARHHADDVAAALEQRLQISEKGRKTGILRVALEGPDPARAAEVVNAVAQAYLRQNVDRKLEEAQRTLAFVNGQLPLVKERLQAAEAALTAYRSRSGSSVDMSLEAKAAVEQLGDVEKKIVETEIQRAELGLRFTEKHPALRALDRRKEQLEAERAAVVGRMKRLPASELESVRLLRDVKVGNELYVLLLDKQQELSLMRSGAIGNVRIVDPALRPRRPVRPNPPQALSLAATLGLLGGVALAFARRALHRGVEDPDLVEQATGLPVYASVPHSPRQEALARARPGDGPLPVLARAEPGELAVESLRSLRTSLQFALMDARGNVVAVAGPSPGIGKSFVAANLAHVVADAGMRVLLVDADMRKGSLHAFFGAERAPGLSDVVSGVAALEAAVRRQVAAGLDFLASGTLPPAASELLLSIRFQAALAAASKQYDLVLVDTPPVLAVTDAALVGRHAAATLVVLRAGQHAMREISLCVKRLAQNGVRPAGFVFNGARRRAGRYGPEYHYHYEYGNGAREGAGDWLSAIGLRRRR